MASQQLFEPFAFETPKDWFSRMEAAHSLLQASSGNTIEKKTYLLATIGSEASLLLTDLLAPTDVNDASVTYDSMKTKLLDHLKCQHLEIAERCQFYSATQGPNESTSEFFGRLKKLAQHCNFGDALDSMLRDRLVLGCRSIQARTKLLQVDPLTLKTVQDTLAIFEAVEHTRGGALPDTSEVHAASTRNRLPRANSRPNSRIQAKPTGTSCRRCGRSMCKSASTCPAMGKTCSNCGKLNHFRVVCQSKRSSVHHSTEPMLHLEAMPTHSMNSRMKMRLNGQACIMELDTGSAATIVSSKMWRSMGSPSLTVSNRLFSAYDGHRMKPLGDIVNCLIEANDVSITSIVTVVESSKQYGLLGRDALYNFVPAPLATNSIEDAELPAMKVEPVTIEIMDETQLRFCKARPVPLPMVDQVDKELQRLERKGIIAPVSNSRWASPIVWVKKRDGSLRMCADFKVHINRSIASDAYPLPTIETIFAGMTDAKVFAKLDLKEAYWQIPLDVKSRELCTINTNKGLFQMLRLPKGMKNSSAVFQRVMELILKNIPGVLIFQDDILLHAPSSDILAKRLSSVLARLDEKGVTVNQSKSILNATEVKFLGHLISSTGIRPDPAIVKKIFSFKPPQSKSELESFLGLVNFFGRMIPDFSKIVNPLHALRKKDVPFQWTYEHQLSFNRLLQVLAEPPVLSSYDLRKPVSLTTDASEKAIGAVLTQHSRPIIFVSRSLTKTEQRYSNIEREALAVVWAVLRLKQFLLGRHFTLITDHKPLEKIYGGAMLPKVTSNRLMRWSILLQRYDFSIRYKPGTEIPHADALTRLQLSSDESSAEDLVINNVAPDISADWLVSLQEATKSDELAQAVIRRLKSDDWRSLQANERHFFRLRHQLSTEDDLLCLSGKCYVPFALRKDVFDSSHQLHTGVHSTIARIKLTSWWPSLHKDVRRWIRNCPSCSKLRPNFVKQLNPWPTCSVFERLHADWCHVPGVGDILVVVDSSSGWIECSLPQARTTSNVIDSLSAVFSRFGVPRVLVTDNAAEFTSQELNNFCRVNGISKMESPPYHPESNGVAERGVQTVKNGLKAWRLDATHMPFKEYLKRLLLHHRACFKRPDGRTPAELVFGRNIRVPLSRDFSFSQPVRYKSRGGTREASFLLERGSNTSWILDDLTNQLRLAHRDQLAQRPSPAQVPTPTSSPVKLASSTPVVPSAEPDPDATLPMVVSPPVLSAVPSPVRPTRPTRLRKKKVISDYNDL